MTKVHAGSSTATIVKASKSRDEDRLKALRAEATRKYSVHDYDEAAELYSQATQLQAELNGEMSPSNADLLYQYGRCLYHVAVRKSDVLGPKVAGEKSVEGPLEFTKKRQPKEQKLGERANEDVEALHRVIAVGFEEENGENKDTPRTQPEKKPYFQFTGDENFEDSDGDEDDLDGATSEEDADEQENDFANAYEVLDLARILLLRRIEEAQKGDTDAEELRHLQERLADTYDLQAEISLEGERFSAAVVDLKAALGLKYILFPSQSSLIAEAHYKLSLALEFSSITEQHETDAKRENEAHVNVDHEVREAAAKEMEAAIESCKLRLKEEGAKMETTSSGNEEDLNSAAVSKNIKDVKDIVSDMEQRLIELRQPPVSIKDRTETNTIEGVNSLGGIVGSILSESPEIQKAKLEAASIGAADLTRLIKRKALTTTNNIEQPNNGRTPKSIEKRKVASLEESKDVKSSKKAKLSDADEK